MWSVCGQLVVERRTHRASPPAACMLSRPSLFVFVVGVRCVSREVVQRTQRNARLCGPSNVHVINSYVSVMWGLSFFCDE